MPLPLSSRHNPRIRAYPSLASESWVFSGEKLVRDVLLHPACPSPHLLVLREDRAGTPPIMPRTPHETWIVPPGLMRHLSGQDSPPELLLLIPPPTNRISVTHGQSFIALVGVQDPGNAGTLVRTAAALGASGVFLCLPGARPENPKFIRAAQTALLEIPMEIIPSHEALWNHPALKDQPFYLSVPPRPGCLTPSEIRESGILLVGSEGQGLPDCPNPNDPRIRWLTLPQKGQTESLNAAIAGAILLHRLLDACPPDRPRHAQA